MADAQELERAFLTEMVRVGGELRFSVSDYLEHNAQEAPNQPAFMEPERESLTYGNLFELARQTVKALNGLGFTTASRIALLLPNSPTAGAVYLSVMAGMAIIPLGVGLAADEYSLLFRHASVDAVLLRQDETPEARVAAAQLGLPVLEVRYVTTGPAGMFELVGADAVSDRLPQFAAPNDLLMVLATSGTTATPKLVTLSHRAMLPTVYTVVVEDSSGVFFQMAPLQHLFGILCLLHALARQQGSVFPPFGNTSLLFQYLARYRPQILLTVPVVLKQMLDLAPKHEAEIAQWDLRVVVTGTTRLDEELRLGLHQRLGLAVRITYGSTEVGLATRLLFRPGEATTKGGSVGPATTVWSRLRIVDEDGVELPMGAVGEIQIASAMGVGSYENNPEANAESFRDGWFNSGDLGYIDDDGYLFISGRVKEVINRSGSKIASLEVDAVLLRHPGVADAASFSFPHAALGEDLAVAVVSNDPALTERDLRLFAADHLALHMVPSRFVFVSEIPRTALGKARRGALTEQFKAALQR